MNRCEIPGLMLEQNQTVSLLLQHHLGFFHRSCMVQFGGQSAPGPTQDLPNQEEIFLLLTHKQDR
jgi:hypothetical protein